LQFFKTFVVILDCSEHGTPWHFVRDNESSLSFGSHCLLEPAALHAHQPQSWSYEFGIVYIVHPMPFVLDLRSGAGQIDRQTDRETDGQTDGQTERQRPSTH